MSKQSQTYSDAGVDIAAGNELVERIKPLVKSTARPGADSDIGGFGGVFDIGTLDFSDPVLISGTDSVGTKVKIAQAAGKFDTIGIDVVAMCVNDILAQGAEPLFFLDYYATGKLDVDVTENIIKGVVEGCKQAGCALIGGETAEMPGVYSEGNFDLVGFAVGATERTKLLPRTESIHDGDILIGLPSSGIHSNGFSLVRKLVEDAGLPYDSPAPFDESKSLGETLLEPTIIYVPQTKAALKGNQIKGLAHITGGGITENIPRVLPNNMAAEIDLSSWEMPPVFNWLQETGNITQEEMLRTFNCGIGMVMVVSSNNYSTVSEIMNFDGIQNIKIGEVIERGDSPIVYKNG